MKKRADLLLVEKKIVASRTKAQAVIMAGQIFIDGKKVLKSGELYNIESDIECKSLHPQWVSRGALKILKALNHFQIKPDGYICLDIGASTGGFSDVLLSKNAKKIFCVDVGFNQLHEKLVSNPKIINIQKTNAKLLNNEIITDKVDLIVCDVSFISMKKVIKPSLNFLKNYGIILGLIKPQFESSKKEIKKGGVILDSDVHKRICDSFVEWFTIECNMDVIGLIESPIKGPKGNTEFLICARKKL